MSVGEHLDTAATDRQWMARALGLAARVRGRVAPNPAVGAVLVRDGILVGEGATEPPEEPHAEVVALRQAGERARGATLYVTLEPCAHYGRTPPCVDALLAAGIARAVVAVRDPYPEVNGRGIRRIIEGGVAVELGLSAEPAIAINGGFFKRVRTGLPEVTAKFAMSLDGRIATRTGHSRWITGPASRREAHRLRDTHDAILVGIGTVLADDPLLTTRLPETEAGAGGPHHPLRVVLDSLGRTPLSAAMLRPHTPGRTLLAVGASASPERVAALRAAGAGVLTLPSCDGRVDLTALLRQLARDGVNTVLVEGGAGVLGALFDLDLVDRVVAFIAPAIIGGRDALAAIGGVGAATMEAATRLRDVEVSRLDGDVMVTGRVHPIVLPEEG